MCRRLSLVVLLVALAAGIAVGPAVPAGHERSAKRPCGTAKRPPAWKHVVWIWLENKAYGEVIGNTSAPYLNRLVAACGLATAYSAISHPSLPNYIAATSGNDWGISDDNPPGSHRLGVASIFSQLTAAGRTWRSYEESMPTNCSQSDSGEYAVRHNPAAYYTEIASQCAQWDVPLGTTTTGALASALRRNRLPAFSFITPNLCDDMHDCSVGTGDGWLRRWVSAIVSSPAYRSGATALFITFDEGEGGSNQVGTVVLSPSTPPGTRSSTPFSHYSLLKTTEQLLGLKGYLAHAGDPTTTSMRTAFHL